MKTKRPIIHIDEEKCTGCGLCVPACEEGALAIVDGKARIVKEIFCDGLGACLGDCPEGALTVIERDAEAFDEEAVLAAQAQAKAPQPSPVHQGCPGSALRTMTPRPSAPASDGEDESASALSHWPVQLMLVPPTAPFLHKADVLLCADCVPFALPDFHGRYLQGRAVLVACPKLDDLAYYTAKLTDILQQTNPRRLTILRMTVPCCGGLVQAATTARAASNWRGTLEVHTVGIEGGVVEREILADPGHGDVASHA